MDLQNHWREPNVRDLAMHILASKAKSWMNVGDSLEPIAPLMDQLSKSVTGLFGGRKGESLASLAELGARASKLQAARARQQTEVLRRTDPQQLAKAQALVSAGVFGGRTDFSRCSEKEAQQVVFEGMGNIMNFASEILQAQGNPGRSSGRGGSEGQPDCKVQ